MNLRVAGYADAEKIIALDEVAGGDRGRVNFIHHAITARTCHVAVEGADVLGYGVLEGWFFGHPIVTMLCVAEPQRRQGVGTALLRHLEAQCSADMLFTTAETSNAPMRALLEKLEYQPSGTVENVDRGEGRVVYFKQLKRWR